MGLLYFNEQQNFLIFTGITLLFASIVCFEGLKKAKPGLLLLLTGSAFIYSAMALLDPFLNNWDEQFHALVAKNFLTHPFTPTLFDKPVIPYEQNVWIANHIWLHKQPLFLWQISLSLKLFGLNEFAVRIPSVIMMTILPVIVYRLGKLALNERIGYYGALLTASAYYMHELVTGFPPSDHNDIAFLFYVTASIWTWMEYENSKKKGWLILTGLFSGCAVLVKWLVGLLVFSGWGISILFNKEKRESLHYYKSILLSFGICLFVFIPWQMYISHAFPAESRYEYSLNSKHFSEVVEEHGGGFLYYFENFRITYGGGQLVPALILLSLFFFYKNIRQRDQKIALIFYIVIVYLFFSLAATKMANFCYIVSPLLFLSLAAMINDAIEFIHVRLVRKWLIQKLITILILSFIAWANLDLYKIAYKHTMAIRPDDNDKRIEKLNDAVFIKNLKNILPPDYVLFNCKPQKNIAVMFYTGNTAYDKNLSDQEYMALKNKGINLAVIDNGKLSDLIKTDQAVLKIRAPDSTW
jgi:4-amino-4-deoxy-L-arabinose transferase